MQDQINLLEEKISTISSNNIDFESAINSKIDLLEHIIAQDNTEILNSVEIEAESNDIESGLITSLQTENKGTSSTSQPLDLKRRVDRYSKLVDDLGSQLESIGLQVYCTFFISS